MSYGQTLEVGDQVAYPIVTCIKSSGIRISRIKQIIQLTAGFAECDPGFALDLENGEWVNPEDVVKTDGNYQYA